MDFITFMIIVFIIIIFIIIIFMIKFCQDKNIMLLFNFAPEANVRAALHRVLYWTRSWVIGMTEECFVFIPLSY